MKNKTALKGFSLVELLVVVAILGTLATFVIVRFTGAQRSAVDTRRQSELRQYQNALEVYATRNNSLYPADLDTDAINLCATGEALEGLPCTQDPKVDTGWIDYHYQSDTNGLEYVLWTQLERSNDYFVLCSDGQVGNIVETAWSAPSGGTCPL